MARQLVQGRSVTFGLNSWFASFFVGAFVGFFGWVLSLAVNLWVLNPIFCRSADSAVACTNAPITAWVIAYVLASVVGLFMLIRANIFRPLLVVLASVVTLWALTLWFVPLVWWVGLVWSTLLFALAYVLYTWLASHAQFLVSLLFIVVVVVLLRLVVVL